MESVRSVKTARTYRPYLLVSGTAGRESIDDYVRRGGYHALRELVRSGDREGAIAAISEAGLRGKGGANFPTGKKWDMVYRAPDDVRYVVCNGGEHEPGSRKDRTLMECYPHAVIEGALIAAFTVRARKVYVYITNDQEAAIRSIATAIDEARSRGLLDLSRAGERFACEVTCFPAPATYVAGEETAALNAIEGQAARPRSKPPYPTVEGLHGKPTLINNVETLATVPAILRHGAAWYRALGGRSGGGGALVTLSSGVNRPGVYEVPFDMTLRELIDDLGQGTIDGRAVKALLPGGPSLPFLDARALDSPIDPEALKAAGSGIGCGAVRLWLEGTCMVEPTLEMAEFFAREQCGLCPACRMETNTFALALQQLRAGKSAGAQAQIEKVAEFAKGKGRCSLIAMAAAPVRSALRLFPQDFECHVRHGRCL